VFGKTLVASSEALGILVIFLSMGVILIGSIQYVIEAGVPDENGVYLRSNGQESPFTDIPASMYWAVTTLTTVG
jgi:hypothetical protein